MKTGVLLAGITIALLAVVASATDPVSCGPGNPCPVHYICGSNGICEVDSVNPPPQTCNDNGDCDVGEVCVRGSCQPQSPGGCINDDDCDEGEVCVRGFCTGQNPTECTIDADCDDEDACNGAEACVSGSCQAGTPLVCDDSNACTDDSCDPAIGCVFADDDANTCDDSDACTQTDTCVAGSCTGSNEKVCPVTDTQCQTPGTCNPADGSCSDPENVEGSCDDGNACTQTDTCVAGSCTGSNEKVCPVTDTQCQTPGTCNPADGSCSDPENVEGLCDDSDACTQTDTCQGGLCTGSDLVVCAALDQCHEAGTCDPASGVCSNLIVDDGTACTDGNACTEGDTCSGGACVDGAALNCDDGDACTSDSCNTVSGCVHTPLSCDDGKACNGVETCVSGRCKPGKPLVCDAPCFKCIEPDGCVEVDLPPGNPHMMCDGVCVNTQNNDDFCGSCNPCPEGFKCRQDACVEVPKKDKDTIKNKLGPILIPHFFYPIRELPYRPFQWGRQGDGR